MAIEPVQQAAQGRARPVFLDRQGQDIADPPLIQIAVMGGKRSVETRGPAGSPGRKAAVCGRGAASVSFRKVAVRRGSADPESAPIGPGQSFRRHYCRMVF